MLDYTKGWFNPWFYTGAHVAFVLATIAVILGPERDDYNWKVPYTIDER